jgi:hypothetical protein
MGSAILARLGTAVSVEPRRPGEDFGVLPHEYKRAPGREFDMAIITVENGGRQT